MAVHVVTSESIYASQIRGVQPSRHVAYVVLGVTKLTFIGEIKAIYFQYYITETVKIIIIIVIIIMKIN